MIFAVSKQLGEGGFAKVFEANCMDSDDNASWEEQLKVLKVDLSP